MAKPRQSDAVLHVGGPTVVLDYAGRRIVSDPTFDPAGRRYRMGRLPLSKLTDPAVSVGSVGKVDVVLLSHDSHPDNFDDAGRKLAARAGVVITTRAAAQHLVGAIGLRTWRSTALQGEDGVTVTITAMPARHAPLGVHLWAGPVTGFLIAAPGHVTVYVSGDNVSPRAVSRVARYTKVDVAILHAGAPRFRASGTIRYCMTARQAAQAARVLGARQVMVVHSEGWGHFSETTADVEAAFSAPDLRAVWMADPAGCRVEI